MLIFMIFMGVTTIPWEFRCFPFGSWNQLWNRWDKASGKSSNYINGPSQWCNLGLVQRDSFDLPKDSSSSYSHTILCQLYVHIHNTHIFFPLFFLLKALYIKSNPWFEFTSNLRNREPKVGLANSSKLQLSWTQNTSQVKPLALNQCIYIWGLSKIPFPGQPSIAQPIA